MCENNSGKFPAPRPKRRHFTPSQIRAICDLYSTQLQSRLSLAYKYGRYQHIQTSRQPKLHFVHLRDLTFSMEKRSRGRPAGWEHNWDGLGDVSLDFKLTFTRKVGRFITGSSTSVRRSWREWTVTNFSKPCAATGYTLGYALYPTDKQSNPVASKWSYSVNETVLCSDLKRKYKDTDHNIKTCEMILSLAQVNESYKIDGKIHRFHLKYAWTQIYRWLVDGSVPPLDFKSVILNYNKCKLDDGVKGLFRRMQKGHKSSDTSAKRTYGFKTERAFFDCFVAAGGRCATSGVVFQLKPGPFCPSFNRCDDAKGHSPDNGRWVCRLFSNHSNMNRADFLKVFLNQNLVELPPAVRAKAEAELTV